MTKRASPYGPAFATCRTCAASYSHGAPRGTDPFHGAHDPRGPVIDHTLRLVAGLVLAAARRHADATSHTLDVVAPFGVSLPLSDGVLNLEGQDRDPLILTVYPGNHGGFCVPRVH